jgi:hypothetical protein
VVPVFVVQLTPGPKFRIAGTLSAYAPFRSASCGSAFPAAALLSGPTLYAACSSAFFLTAPSLTGASQSFGVIVLAVASLIRIMTEGDGTRP